MQSHQSQTPICQVPVPGQGFDGHLAPRVLAGQDETGLVLSVAYQARALAHGRFAFILS